uniref:Uncharacterized protein n=1 Tax=viral metagenome TaxID=1070528 RepID=A0A6M3K145_9ZZZZ
MSLLLLFAGAPTTSIQHVGAGPGRRTVNAFYGDYAEHHERREAERLGLRAQILLEENELVEIIEIICVSGVLDE